MFLGGLVDAGLVRPHAEVADVQHPLEAHAERLLEGEDVLVEPIEGSVDVAGGADDHGSPRLVQKSTSRKLLHLLYVSTNYISNSLPRVPFCSA